MAVQAETIAVRRAEAELVDGRLAVSTRFAPKLPSGLAEALNQGVALSFRLEFELTRPRWTSWRLSVGEWFDPHDTLHFKLQLQSLTGRYRLTIGNLARYYASQDEALAAVGAIAGWRVLGPGQLSGFAASEVKGRVRLMFDRSELPRPFQLNALGNEDWALASEWAVLNVKE